METIIQPVLYCPFPTAINKHADSLHQYTIDWVNKFDLMKDDLAYQKFCNSRFAELAACTYPDAGFTDLKLLSDWHVWLFSLDDQFDEADIGKKPELLAAFNIRLMNLLRGVETVNQIGSLGVALQDILQRIEQREVNDKLMNRFIHSVEVCLEASVWEATNRARGITPDVDTYIKMRVDTSGIQTIFNFIGLANLFELSPEVLDESTVQNLSLKAINIISWANDIVSCDKEMKCGDVHNLVLTLKEEHKYSLQEAVYKAAALHDLEMKAFIELENQLPSFGVEINLKLESYISILRAWIRGNLDWQYKSERYRLAVEVAMETA